MQIQLAELTQKELDELIRMKKARQEQREGFKWYGPLSQANRWVYERMMCSVWYSLPSAKKRLAVKIEKLKAQERALEDEPLEPTGNAIIGFADRRSAHDLLAAQNQRSTWAVLNNFLPPGAIRGLHVLTGAIHF
jgi:hypothetical protein